MQSLRAIADIADQFGLDARSTYALVMGLVDGHALPLDVQEHWLRNEVVPVLEAEIDDFDSEGFVQRGVEAAAQITRDFHPDGVPHNPLQQLLSSLVAPLGEVA